MNGFLAALVERAMGGQATLRVRVPSLYEPRPDGDRGGLDALPPTAAPTDMTPEEEPAAAQGRPGAIPRRGPATFDGLEVATGLTERTAPSPLVTGVRPSEIGRRGATVAPLTRSAAERDLAGADLAYQGGDADTTSGQGRQELAPPTGADDRAPPRALAGERVAPEDSSRTSRPTPTISAQAGAETRASADDGLRIGARREPGSASGAGNRPAPRPSAASVRVASAAERAPAHPGSAPPGREPPKAEPLRSDEVGQDAGGRPEEDGQRPPPLRSSPRASTVPAAPGPGRVTIHIGRVEVRALAPESAPARPATATAQGGLSLDAYLRRLTEGGS
jgi:hypothetical protein